MRCEGRTGVEGLKRIEKGQKFSVLWYIYVCGSLGLLSPIGTLAK